MSRVTRYVTVIASFTWILRFLTWKLSLVIVWRFTCNRFLGWYGSIIIWHLLHDSYDIYYMILEIDVFWHLLHDSWNRCHMTYDRCHMTSTTWFLSYDICYRCHMTHNRCHMTSTTWQMSSDIYYMILERDVIWHITDVIWHITDVIWHMTDVIWHLLHDSWNRMIHLNRINHTRPRMH